MPVLPQDGYVPSDDAAALRLPAGFQDGTYAADLLVLLRCWS